jgi:hypothetical protein
MKRIAVMTPTRQRAAQCLNHVQSIITRAFDKENLIIHIWLDENDPELDDYKTYLREGPYAEWIATHIGPQQPLGKCWNHMALMDKKSEIFFMGNDDWFMQTHGWDQIVRQWDAMPPYNDGIYVFYPHDNNDGKCTFPIVSKKWIETTGYFVPEIFEFLANDTYLEKVGRMLDRLSLISVEIDHRHFAFGKAEYDQTYKQHRASGATKRDVKLLNESSDLIKSDVEKLKALLS